jgi:opacity protein-like surface antigen
MANVLYDVPLDLPVQPFIGGGVGLVHTDVAARGTYPFCDICEKTPICFVCSIPLNANGSSDRFGFQGVAGFSWPFAPQWALDATYRYVRANGVTWATPDSSFVFGSDRFRADYSDNTVTLGIRYDFDGG